jgi:hypothetical protein
MPAFDTFALHQAIPHEEFDYVLLKSVLSGYVGILKILLG